MLRPGHTWERLARSEIPQKTRTKPIIRHEKKTDHTGFFWNAAILKLRSEIESGETVGSKHLLL